MSTTADEVESSSSGSGQTRSTLSRQQDSNRRSESDARARLVAVGDVFLDRVEPLSAFAATVDYLRGFDVAFANLEAPIAHGGELKIWSSKILLRMRPAMIDGLVAAGFSVVSLANNHAMDYSASGLVETIGHLRQRGIEPVGAGSDSTEACRPVIVERNQIRIGFLAFQATEHDSPDMRAKQGIPGLNQVRLSPFYPPPLVNPSDLDEVRRSIRELRAKADVVVASFHWGIAGLPDLAVPQMALAQEAAAAGADLVIGHHSHVPQALALIGRTVVAFGLGNFVFDWEFPRFVPERLVLECDLDAHGVRRAVVRPALAEADGVPRLLDASTGRGREICERVLALSANFGRGVTYEPESGGLVVGVT